MKNPHSDIADERILALVLQKGGDAERGFRMLMEKYQERLYWQIRRMVYEHEDANDILQNCFVKIYRNIHSFEGKSKLYTWMYRIATNEAITFLKKKKQKYAASLDDEDRNLSNRLEADQYFDGDAAQVVLQKAIALLPDKQKQVFHLRYFDEMSYAGMSELLGTSEGALKASFHHAVKKIEAYVKNVETF
ncbi:MAG: RNA polymerase sigma factor [Saprospiraceae bacterium]